MEFCHSCAALYFWYVTNATAYHLGQYSLHLLLLKTSVTWRLKTHLKENSLLQESEWTHEQKTNDHTYAK